MRLIQDIHSELSLLMDEAYSEADANGGIIPDWLGDKIDALEGEKADILKQIALSTKERMLELEKIKALAKELDAKRVNIEISIQKSLELIERFDTDRAGVKDSLVVVKWTNSEKCVPIVGKEEIDNRFIRYKQSSEIDVAGLKEALKNNDAEASKYAKLVTSKKVSIK